MVILAAVVVGLVPKLFPEIDARLWLVARVLIVLAVCFYGFLVIRRML
jgi:hypothetical protein